MSSSLPEADRIDLTPDSLLLDAHFDGYKLSLEPFPVKNVKLDPPARVLYASEGQWALPHVKLFGDHNNLLLDRASSTLDEYVLFVVVEDCSIMRVTFTHGTKTWTAPRVVASLSLPACASRLPVTVSFLDSRSALVADGCGDLIVYDTGDRVAGSEAWKKIGILQPVKDSKADEKQIPFVVLDSRQTGDDHVEILLLSVVERDGDEQAQPTDASTRTAHASAFLNRLDWITVDSIRGTAGAPSISRRRSLVQPGHLEFACFDHKAECVIVAGTARTRLEIDSAKPVERHGDALTLKTTSSTVTMEDVSGTTAKAESGSAYVWSQTADSVTAVFSVDASVRKNDIGFSISPQSIHLNIKNTVLLGGQLGGVVDVAESTWTIENGRIELTLFKEAGRLAWTELVIGDNRGEYQPDSNALADMADRLSMYTSDSPALGADGIGENFNAEQLEECDVADVDSCFLLWINGQSHRTVFEADISGHQILFASRLHAHSPLSLCLRHDVDGVLWEFADDPRRPIVHRTTFNALGYVQASKQERRFTTCAPDGGYATIVESQRHAFIYWQPTAVDGDLRNRKNGRRVATIAKQQLVSIEEGDAAIVGVAAGDNTLFLLTERRLYAVVVREAKARNG